MAVLIPFAEGIWTLPTPGRFFGLELRTRMTVVRLSSGDLFVHSPVALTDGLAAEVEALGPVRHVVAPNVLHHLYAGAWIERFDTAELHAPAELMKKRKDLRVDHTLTAQAPESWRGELEQVRIEGTLLHETVFFHPRSGTLISADLLECFEGSDHFPTRCYLKLCGLENKRGIAPMLRWAYRDKGKAREGMRTLLGWDFDRATVPHGSNVDSGAKALIEETYRFLF